MAEHAADVVSVKELIYAISLLVSAIVAVSSALVYLFFMSRKDAKRDKVEVKSLYEKFITEQKDAIQTMTELANDSKHAIENNSRQLENNNAILREFIRKL